MKRPAQNFVIDAISFAAFVFLAATGVIMMYILPPGSGHATTLWGMDRHQWGDVHFWIAIGFIGLLAVHLILHWKWIVCMVKGKQKQGQPEARTRVALGLVGVFALLALAAAPILTPTEQTQRGGAQHRAGSAEHQASLSFDESITLAEIAYVTGIPAAHLTQRLALPAHVSPEESLHRLQARHHVGLEDVRRILREEIASPTATLALPENCEE